MDQYDELVEKAIKEYGMKSEAAVRYAKATIAAKKYAASKEFQVVQQLAEKTGLTASEVLWRGLNKQFPDGNIPEEAAKAIVTPVLHENYTVVSEVTETVQKDILEEAGVGINPLVPPFNKDRADGIAKAAANGASAAEFENIVINHSRNIVDESIKQNARVHQQMGLEPRVTRIYDGVGVHKRKDPCAWCKARAGVDMPYREAYAKGSFERHPGCGCEILYKVGKRVQRQSDWTRNEWEDTRVYGIIKPDKKYLAQSREVYYLRGGETSDVNESKHKTTKSIAGILKELSESSIKEIPVSPLEKELNSEEARKKVQGKDRSGSCTSLALAYIGNRIGLDVTDLRGGASARYFAETEVIRKIVDLANGKTIKNENDFESIKILKKGVKKDKEYFLSTGRHSAIIRKADRGFEYLKLQDGLGYGFARLDNKALKEVFGCSKTHTIHGIHYEASSMLFDISELEGSLEFIQMLGYINTKG